MEKQEDPFDALQTGLYMDGLKEERDQFPYNMREVRELLSATGEDIGFHHPRRNLGFSTTWTLRVPEFQPLEHDAAVAIQAAANKSLSQTILYKLQVGRKFATN